MNRYKALQIIKHALAYYIGRGGASEAERNTERLLLVEVEEMAETLREYYRIPKKPHAAATCPHCSGGFVRLNASTADYSGVEVSLSPKLQQLRVRYGFDDPGAQSGQDLVEISHCPMCGRALKQGGKEK